MKKICIDARMIHHSGIGVYIKNILRELIQSDRYKITVLTDKPYPELKNVDIIIFKYKIYSVSEQLFFPLYVPHCDIFWSPHFNIPVLPIKAKHRLVTVHDVFHLAFAKQLSYMQQMYARLIFAAISKQTQQAIITVSEFSKSEILKYTKILPEKISVIYNGVDRDFFKIKKNHIQQQSILNEYGLLGQYLVFVGNVKPHKNLKNLIYAFRSFCQTVSGYKLVIIGKKEGFINGDESLIDLINSQNDISDKVIFTGHVKDDELATIYQRASLLIFPSLYEGFGFPPLESMAAGTPVLCSNTGPMPEICGSSVTYCNPYNIDDIAEKISVALQRGDDFTDISQQYTWHKSAEKHISLIENIF